MQNIKNALILRGITKKDELLDCIDLINTIIEKGGEINSNGYVALYHATTLENAQNIINEQKMYGREDGIFFSTKANRQILGYGNTIIKALIPVEKLILDDEFEDELHFKIYSPIDKKISLEVSLYN